MLGSSKSNIYVSVAEGTQQQIDGETDHQYRKPQPSWYLSVEPKGHSVPCVPVKKHPQPVHYTATLNAETNSYDVRTWAVTKGEAAILGNILVAEKAHATLDQVLTLLKTKLAPGESSLPSEHTSEDDPEHWIRKALHILQNGKVLDAFDVGEFMTYAHAYAANRAQHEAPAMVAYPRLNKNHEEKAKTHGFWVSYPQASKVKPRSRIEGDQKKYGGLM